MKKFIYKTNQYLLENYPLLWNTRAIWMLATAIILHLFFFLFGLTALMNPETLHDRSAFYIFFENGSVFFSVMISILMIVIWLIYLFKNNAFKNFYPTSAFSLFKQFLLFFIILLFSTSFYYSYTAGVKTYIVNTYEEETITNEIVLANKVAPFLSQSVGDYTINNLIYPQPFDSLYCETDNGYIDFSEVYYQYINRNYQYYSLKEFIVKEDNFTRSFYDTKDSLKHQLAFYKNLDSSTVYYIKDKVIDVTKHLKSTAPSYYNYSDVFYSKAKQLSFNEKIYYTSGNYENNKNKLVSAKKVQKNNQELLDRNNPKEIKQLLSDYLVLANKYNVEHNLTADTWFNLIYEPEAFKLKKLIRGRKKKQGYPHSNYDSEAEEELYKSLITNYYIESSDIQNVFENIDEIRDSEIISENLHIFIWISFTIAMLVFVFRLTGLKALLFSIVASGLLGIIIGLSTTVFDYISSERNKDVEFFAVYLTLFIGTFILFTSLFLTAKLKKQITSVFINITLVGFVPYVLLIIGIISMHQRSRWNEIPYITQQDKELTTLIDYFGLDWSYILLGIGILFIFLFSKTVLKWKALPEG